MVMLTTSKTTTYLSGHALPPWRDSKILKRDQFMIPPQQLTVDYFASVFFLFTKSKCEKTVGSISWFNQFYSKKTMQLRCYCDADKSKTKDNRMTRKDITLLINAPVRYCYCHIQISSFLDYYFHLQLINSLKY